MMSFIKFIIILISVLKVALPITMFDARDEEEFLVLNHCLLTKLFYERNFFKGMDKMISFLDRIKFCRVYRSAPSTMTNKKVVGLKSFIINEVNFNIFGMEFQFDSKEQHINNYW